MGGDSGGEIEQAASPPGRGRKSPPSAWQRIVAFFSAPKESLTSDVVIWRLTTLVSLVAAIIALVAAIFFSPWNLFGRDDDSDTFVASGSPANTDDETTPATAPADTGDAPSTTPASPDTVAPSTSPAPPASTSSTASTSPTPTTNPVDETSGEGVPLVATAVPVVDTFVSSYWFMDELPDPAEWLAGATVDQFVADLATQLEMVAAPSMARLTLENTGARGMTITDARYRVISCEPPAPKISFRQNYDGAGEVIGWAFTIGGDEVGPTELEDGFEVGQFFDDQVITLDPGELVNIDATFTTVADQCDVVIDLDVTFQGSSRTVTVDQAGEPFRTIPEVDDLPSFQGYWACIAHHGRFEYADDEESTESILERIERNDGSIDQVWIESDGGGGT